MNKLYSITIILLLIGSAFATIDSNDSTVLQSPAFIMALKGHTYYKTLGKISSDTIIVIDFDLPSTAKRMFIYDIKNKRILHTSLVAHGKNTGQNRATSFSNEHGSNKSSLGFFRTAERYSGKHGLSLRLDGLEKGVNHRARARAIVIHSAWYVSDDFVHKYKRLGRSYGCPALPFKDYEEVIDLIDNQLLLFIYSSATNYQPPFKN